jgi:hypothetical protein
LHEAARYWAQPLVCAFMSRSVFHRGARGGIDNAVLVLHCNIRGDRQCAGEYTAMIETAPLEQAADAYARMMQGKARFRMVLVTTDGVAHSVRPAA